MRPRRASDRHRASRRSVPHATGALRGPPRGSRGLRSRVRSVLATAAAHPDSGRRSAATGIGGRQRLDENAVERSIEAAPVLTAADGTLPDREAPARRRRPRGARSRRSPRRTSRRLPRRNCDRAGGHQPSRVAARRFAVPGGGSTAAVRGSISGAPSRDSVRTGGDLLTLPRLGAAPSRVRSSCCAMSAARWSATRGCSCTSRTLSRRRHARVEAFLFSTRLTRDHPQLRTPRIDDAVTAVSGAVPDWSGGTRIGSALQQLRRRWSRRVLRGGPVVLLISDGWDRGDPAELRQEMSRLKRSCRRLVWLNPLIGTAGLRAVDARPAGGAAVRRRLSSRAEPQQPRGSRATLERLDPIVAWTSRASYRFDAPPPIACGSC